MIKNGDFITSPVFGTGQVISTRQIIYRNEESKKLERAYIYEVLFFDIAQYRYLHSEFLNVKE